MSRSLSNNGTNRSPEFWLTPGIGLCLLAPLIWHWRIPLAEHSWAILGEHQLAHLGEKVALAVCVGVVPLLVVAGVLRALRAWKWPGWAQVIAALVIGYLAVYYFYYYAIYPFPHWELAQDEGQGNTLAIYDGDVFFLGVFSALAAALSAILTKWLMYWQRGRP